MLVWLSMNGRLEWAVGKSMPVVVNAAVDDVWAITSTARHNYLDSGMSIQNDGLPRFTKAPPDNRL